MQDRRYIYFNFATRRIAFTGHGSPNITVAPNLPIFIHNALSIVDERAASAAGEAGASSASPNVQGLDVAKSTENEKATRLNTKHHATVNPDTDNNARESLSHL